MTASGRAATRPITQPWLSSRLESRHPAEQAISFFGNSHTSKPAAAHKIYPYLLRGLAIERVNQVWCSDVTYIPMAKGFLYLVVIMDWVSRAVLAWRLSNTLDADFCVEALEEALARHGRPEIFNTDQGSQFTSDGFTGTLKRHGVMISTDGKGRCMDNIFVERLWRSLKYEEVLPQCLCNSSRSQGRHRRLASVLQRGAPAPESGLSHATADLSGRPVGMWTIGAADRLRFPRLPSKLGRRGNAHLRPHTHRHHSQQNDCC
jgi:transposase InsO family protein